VYVAGIGEPAEKVYIVAASGTIRTLSSLYTGIELDTVGRRRLWEEVRRYWAEVPRRAGWTKLKEPYWS
jgi:hypothetical protein